MADARSGYPRRARGTPPSGGGSWARPARDLFRVPLGTAQCEPEDAPLLAARERVGLRRRPGPAGPGPGRAPPSPRTLEGMGLSKPRNDR